MAPVLLEIKDVSVALSARSGLFRMRERQVVDGINLTVCAGERVGVIGCNGAGKSTLLQLAAGLLRPDCGTVRTADDARVMLLTLMMGFDHRLTGNLNAMMAAIFMGATRAEARAALPRIAEFAELESYMETPLHAYSAGMKARLGFAVSQVLEAELVLIDEMLGVGDEGFREKSMEALRGRFCADQTVLLVSHNLRTIEELCPRVVWVDNGVIRADGDGKTVIDEYRHFVAGDDGNSAVPRAH